MSIPSRPDSISGRVVVAVPARDRDRRSDRRTRGHRSAERRRHREPDQESETCQRRDVCRKHIFRTGRKKALSPQSAAYQRTRTMRPSVLSGPAARSPRHTIDQSPTSDRSGRARRRSRRLAGSSTRPGNDELQHRGEHGAVRSGANREPKTIRPFQDDRCAVRRGRVLSRRANKPRESNLQPWGTCLTPESRRPPEKSPCGPAAARAERLRRHPAGTPTRQALLPDRCCVCHRATIVDLPGPVSRTGAAHRLRNFHTRPSRRASLQPDTDPPAALVVASRTPGPRPGSSSWHRVAEQRRTGRMPGPRAWCTTKGPLRGCQRAST